MLREFTELMAAVPRNAVRDDYTTAIVDENVLGKRTHATRKSSRQRLSELYGLDPGIPLFRVLRHLWSVDAPGRPLLAFLCALARDPLLRATSAPVLALSVEEELVRSELFDTLREAVGPRMNDSILDKVVRNVASSWTQAGHLSGHVRKVRRRVAPTGVRCHRAELRSLSLARLEAQFKTLKYHPSFPGSKPRWLRSSEAELRHRLDARH